MINYDLYSNIPMGFCSGNATDGLRKPTINPINKRRVGSNSCPPFLFSQSQHIKKAVSTSLNLPHRATTAQVDKRMGQFAQNALWPELTGCRTSDKMRLGKGEIPDDGVRGYAGIKSDK